MSGVFSTTFAGQNGFVWFMGTVEDIEDPLRLGRIRVRILGFHTEDKVDIPTEALPWAFPAMPITSASMSGIGQTPFGLLPGSWVFGFFQDGQHAQQPVIIGSFHGEIDEEPNYTRGFSDPSKTYPRFGKETGKGKNPIRTDVNSASIATNKAYSPIAWRLRTRIQKIFKAWPFNSYEEPETKSNPDYAKNHVRETESGHHEEYDDTPGHERIHRMHRSGTFQEIYPDGSEVVRILGDGYEIVLKDKNVAVQGDLNITVQGNVTLLTNGDVEQRVKGDYSIAVDGDYRITTKGDYAVYADGKVEEHAGGDLATYSKGKTTIGAAGYISVAATGITYVDGAMVEFNLPGPGSPDTTDEIADRRTSIPSDLIADMGADEILDLANIDTAITDRVQFR